MDFKGMKKVAETQHRATFAHPDGHKIHIAKAALSPALQKQVSALPIHNFEKGGEASTGLDGGGEIADPIAAAKAATQKQDPNQEPQYADDANPAATFTPVPVDPALQPGTPESLAQDESQSSLNPQPAIDPNANVNAMQGGAEALQGIQGEAKALQTKSGQDVQTQKDYRKGADSIHTSALIDYSNIQKNIGDLTHDLMTHQIDPRHYQENMSTGSKIATALGLLAGGVGAAKTGGQNPAFQFLQSQIQRDIESQKTAIDTKHTLLGALYKQYGNRQVAEHVAMATLSNLTASKIAQATAQAANPLAAAAMHKYTAQLQQQAGQSAQQAGLSSMRSKIEQMPSGPGLEGAADAYESTLRQGVATGNPIAGKELEDFTKRRIPGVGLAKGPVDDKTRQTILDKTEMAGALADAKDYLSTHAGFGAIPGTGDYARGQAIQGRLKLAQGAFSNLSRYTAEEGKIYHITTPNLTGTHITDQDTDKLGVLEDYNNRDLNTIFAQNGINKKVQSTPAPVKGADNQMYQKDPATGRLTPVKK